MKPVPQDKLVSIEGLRFHYREWGAGGRDSLLLVHGLASTCHIWDLVAPLLADDFRVVAMDQRGHGETDKPDGGYDFDTVASDLDRFVRAVHLDRPLVVGHSWGADVAMAYAADYDPGPSGLCLIDGGTHDLSAAPDMTLQRAREELAPPDFTGMTVEQLREMSRDHDFGFELTPEVQDIMMASFEVLADGTVRARFPRRHHMAVIEAFWEHRPFKLYPRVLCPALLLPTRREGETSPSEHLLRKEESLESAQRALPISKTVWFEDSVHDVPLQRPAAVAAVIREHIANGFFDRA